MRMLNSSNANSSQASTGNGCISCNDNTITHFASASASPMDSYLNSLGKGSRRAMGQALGVIAGVASGQDEPADPRAYAWHQIGADDAVRIRRELAGRYAASTVNKMLAALRGVMRACRDLGLIDEAGYQAVARLNSLKSGGSRPSRILTDNEISALFGACVVDGTAAGLRNAALLAVFLSAAPRREEVTELNAEDYEPRKRILHIRSAIRERDRELTLPPGAGRALDDWLAARGTQPGPLLTPVDKAGTIRDRRLTDQAVYLILRSIGEQAGIGPITTRDLRSTLIVRQIASGLDYESISRHVGYLSWLSAQAYRGLARETAKAEAATLDLPYPPKDKGA
jgi:integrase